jgi:hypothetical protein
MLIDNTDMTVFRTCTSSIYASTYGQLMVDFDCSRIVATLGLSFFIWGLGKYAQGHLRGLRELTKTDRNRTVVSGTIVGGLLTLKRSAFHC